VEDSASDAAMAMKAMRNGGKLDIVRAADGAQALELLFGADASYAPAIPRVVLLDLKLPKLSGLEVLKKIRQDPRTRKLPVVMLTSSGEQRDVNDCYEAGANSYVVKPVRFEQYRKTLKNLRRYWLEVNLAPR
jgi:two-component system response regulator